MCGDTELMTMMKEMKIRPITLPILPGHAATHGGETTTMVTVKLKKVDTCCYKNGTKSRGADVGLIISLQATNQRQISRQINSQTLEEKFYTGDRTLLAGGSCCDVVE